MPEGEAGPVAILVNNAPSETTLQSFQRKFLHQHQASWVLYDGCFASGQFSISQCGTVRDEIFNKMPRSRNKLGIFLVILLQSNHGFDSQSILD